MKWQKSIKVTWYLVEVLSCNLALSLCSHCIKTMIFFIWKIQLYLQCPLHALKQRRANQLMIPFVLIFMGIWYFFVSKLIFRSYKNENQQNPFLFLRIFNSHGDTVCFVFVVIHDRNFTLKWIPLIIDMMRVSSIHELGQIFNNALCFFLYWLWISLFS